MPLTSGEFEPAQRLRARLAACSRATTCSSRRAAAAPVPSTARSTVGRLRRKLELDPEDPQIIQSVAARSCIPVPQVLADDATARRRRSASRCLPGSTKAACSARCSPPTPDGLIVADAQAASCWPTTRRPSCSTTPWPLVGLHVEALVPDAIRPRHADFRGMPMKAPPAADGYADGLVAPPRRSEGMVEIALSPLQEQGLPYVVAAIRGIGSYPRVRQALQRALRRAGGAVRPPRGRCARPRAAGRAAAASPSRPAGALRRGLPAAGRTGSISASPPCAGPAPGERRRHQPNRSPGHHRADEPDAEHLLCRALARRAGVQCAGRASSTAAAACRPVADAPARFGDDEPARARQPKTSRRDRGAAHHSQRLEAWASSPAASRTTSTTC